MAALVGPPTNPGLYAPILRVESDDEDQDEELRKIVARLMTPEVSQYCTNGDWVTLDKTWVLGIAGPERFETADRYHKLVHSDPLALKGPYMGLPQVMVTWMKSEPERWTFPAVIFFKQR